MSTRQDQVQVRVEIDGQTALNELGKLEMQAQEINNSLRSMKKGTDEYNAASAKLDETRERMREVREEVGITGLTMRQLRQYQQELKREWDNTTQGTARFRELDAQLKEVNQHLAQQQQQLRALPVDSMLKLRENVGLAGMSLAQLTAYQKELNAEFAQLAPTDELFAATAEEVRNTQASIDSLRNATKDVEPSMRGLAQNVGLVGLSMNELKAYQKELSEEWAKIPQGSEEYNKLEAEVKDVNRAIAEQNERLKETPASLKPLVDQVGVAGLNMKQLLAYQKELREEWENEVAGTQRFKELDTQLNEVTGTIERQQGKLSSWAEMWKNAKSEMFSTFAQAGLVGAVVGLYMGIQSLLQGAADLSDSFSDIQKTTGMTTGEVQALNTAFRGLDTRTATKDLRDIAVVAGQLGIAKKDVLDFVDATDKLVVSLGDEFTGGAEQVTKEMGGLRNVLLDIKSDQVADDMLHIGNAINALGSAGSATGPVIADFSNRIGGVGITMGLTSAQVLGMSATMQELQITTERGGTAVVKILQHMAQSPAEYAKVAKMGAQQFADLVNNDIYAAFKKVTEGAAGSAGGAIALAKTLDDLGVDGAGASEVMAKLGTNTKLLQEKVDLAGKALHSTDSIMDEFSKKNDNAAGKMEKLGKLFSSAFNLSGAFSGGINLVIDGLTKLTGLDKPVDALNQAWKDQTEVVKNLTTNAEPLLDKYDQLQKRAAAGEDVQKELKTTLQQIATVIPEAVTEWDKYGNAVGASTKAGREFIQQQKEMQAYRQKDVIAETTQEIKRLEAAIKQTTKDRNRGTKTEFDGDVVREEKYSPQELARMKANIERWNKELLALEGILAQAKGEKSKAQIAAELAEQQRLAALKNKKVLDDATEQLGILEQIALNIKNAQERQNKTRNEAQIKQEEQYIDAQQKLREQLLGKWKDKEAKKDKDTRQKEHDAILADFHRLQDQVHKAREKVNLDELTEDERELQQVAQKYDEMEKAADAFYRNEKLTLEERGLALLEIQRIQEAKRVDLEQTAEAQRKARAKVRHDNMVAEVTAEANLRVILAQAAIDADPQDRSTGADGQTNQDRLMQAKLVQVAKVRDIELRALQDKAALEKLTQEEIEFRRQEIIAESEAKIAGIRKQTRDEQKQYDLQAAEEFLGYVQQATATIYQAIGQMEASEAKKEEKQKKDRLKSLEQEYKAGRMAKEEYERKKNDIEVTAERSAAQRKREAAEHEKAGAVAQATIQGIVAVVRALADGGPFAGPGLAVFMGALAAAQIAMILATPIPEFREGGFTTQEALDLPHQRLAEHKGGMLQGGAFLATVNEAGEEYLVPNKLLSDPVVADHVQAIEAIRTSGTSTVRTTPAIGAYVEGGSTGGTMMQRVREAMNPTANQPMSEATGQQIVGHLQHLTDLWEEGKVIRSEVVPEDLARSEKLLNQINNEASF